MRQAITTKYLGPTNSKGGRIKAEAEAGSVTIPYPYELSTENAHLLAAAELAQQLGWYRNLDRLRLHDQRQARILHNQKAQTLSPVRWAPFPQQHLSSKNALCGGTMSATSVG